jgi:hypothetical protein
MKTFVAGALLIFALNAPVAGQRAETRLFAARDTGAAQAALRPLRVAKWTTFVVGMTMAGYGFSANKRADNRYNEIERLCIATPTRCLGHNADGSYTDMELETLYQNVRGLDHRSRAALIAGQASIAASIVFFILDLRSERAPGNVPYDPRKFSISPTAQGVELSVRVR